jgi:hypothetical protein
LTVGIRRTDLVGLTAELCIIAAWIAAGGTTIIGISTFVVRSAVLPSSAAEVATEDLALRNIACRGTGRAYMAGHDFRDGLEICCNECRSEEVLAAGCVGAVHAGAGHDVGRHVRDRNKAVERSCSLVSAAYEGSFAIAPVNACFATEGSRLPGTADGKATTRLENVSHRSNIIGTWEAFIGVIMAYSTTLGCQADQS